MDRADDALGDAVLELEDVLDAALVAVGPDVDAGRRVDQLRRDTQSSAGLPHTTFQDVADAELLANLLDAHRLALVGEGRVSRDDEKGADTRQRRGDLLHHAVREIFLFGIAAHVLEGQHGDRRLVGQRQRFPHRVDRRG